MVTFLGFRFMSNVTMNFLDLIGRVFTTLREITCGISSYQLPLKDPSSYSESSGAFSVDFVTPVTAENRSPLAPAYR